MKFIFGIKQNMVQVFDKDGNVIPATVISAMPNTVTQVKTKDGKDGYDSVQLGFGVKKEKRINKAQKGHFKTLGNFAKTKEVLLSEKSALNVGDKVSVEQFIPGDMVCVSGISKGKGFQGVIKRHGFKGQPRTHGQKHSEHAPGSIGGGLRTGPRKGMRMGGRMGADMISVKNLKIVEVNKDLNQIVVSGAVPGRRGTVVEIFA